MDFKTAIFTKYIRSLYKINLEKSNIVHKTLIEAIYKVFVQIDNDIDIMRLQICLTTASGLWLDIWGNYFGISRKPNESDELYSQRMVADIIEPKATLTSLRKAAARWLNFTFGENYDYTQIEAHEPWKDLIVTSHRGRTSEFGRLPDSVYWTHAVVDLAIPDASEMTAELIVYLNTIKAAGVQLTWHRTMGWDVLTGLFETDSVKIWIDRYIDLFLKRENEVTDGIRTSWEYTLEDSSYHTPISVSGYLSGRQMMFFEIELERDLPAYRYLHKIVHTSPTVTLGMYSDILDKELSDITVDEMTKLEFQADDQIPNLDNIGKSFDDEIEKYLDKKLEQLEPEVPDEYYNNTVGEVIDMLSTDEESLQKFLEDWRRHNYLNKPLSDSLLTRSILPIDIHSEKYMIPLGIIRSPEFTEKITRIFGVDSVYDLVSEIYGVIDLSTGGYYDTWYYRNFSVESVAKLYRIELENLSPQLVDSPTSDMILNWLNYGNKLKFVQQPTEIISEPI